MRSPARPRHRSAFCAIAFDLALAGFLVAAPIGARAGETDPLTKISGPSPFANCTADNAGSQRGRNYPQSEIEPWIDPNPTNAQNLIAGWQQDRWSNGGARGLVSAYTGDGGATWHESPVPKVTACLGGR